MNNNNNSNNNGNGSGKSEISELLAALGNPDLTSVDIGQLITQLYSLKLEREKRERAERAEREKQDRLNAMAAARAAREEQERLRREAEERRKRELEQKRLQAEEQKRAHIAEITCMDLPLDFDNAFFGDERARGVHAGSIGDGYVYSLCNVGRVDIEYISAITGASPKDVLTALKGSIYQNPETWGECFYKGWESADEYLSGNLIAKLKAAQKANADYGGYFEDNVRALTDALPPALSSGDIYVTLGSPWVPSGVIFDFIAATLGKPDFYHKPTVLHDEYTGSWEIKNKSRYKNRVRAYNTYGTRRVNAIDIIEDTLNMRTVAVYDNVRAPLPGDPYHEKRVFNQAETTLALEKQQKLLEKFRAWVWQDEARAERLRTIYVEKYGCVRARRFDGAFLSFPGMSPSVSLYPYQKNAVARIIFSPNTLLAHDVGAGKTYVMIAAAMELKRMGLSQKNLFVVPNNIVGQWKSIFLQMYPAARLLTVEPKSFKPDKRAAVLKSIRDDDYDGIIMAYSCFDLIPLSKRAVIDRLQERITKLRDARSVTPAVRRALDKARKEIEKAFALSDNDPDAPYFDRLGITRLFVDEAHNYKNVPIETKTSGVLGISSSGSSKCKDMMNKVRSVQRKNRGGGVVFATGTPVTNSLTDVFVMQSYLQSGELALLNIANFDGWIGMFAEKETAFEIDVDAGGFRMATRFGKFHNLPELTAVLASIADFYSVPSGGILPEFRGYTNALVGRTQRLTDILLTISERADAVRSGKVSRADDNMLKITTDGRKAALDVRLIDERAPFDYQSKVARCAENVLNIYNKTAAGRLTQLVFCDSSTPKAGFNLYDELKRLLVGAGVPEGEIEFVHAADTERARTALFKKVNDGTVRILLGSTFKLGIGVNVQSKLIAVHHLDVPWRPADMVQREGRILRQGNTNKEIFIYRYITEGSFDAYSWQLLESKQRFISALLSNAIQSRSGGDVDDCVLSYAEVKALAIGNPLIKKRVETANELARYVALQKKTAEEREALRIELSELKTEQTDLALRIAAAERDIAFVTKNADPPLDNKQRAELREKLFSALCDNLLATEDSVLCAYRGFDIVLPANMIYEKKYVWLRREGKYYVEMSDSDRGGLLRIDNFIDELPDRLAAMQSRLLSRRTRAVEISAELDRTDNYADKIDELRAKLEKLDKQLKNN